MKKILCILSIILCFAAFVGCDSKSKAETNFNNHLIEVRNNLFVAEDDDFYATVCTGQREQEYALDGVVNEMVPFGIVTFARLDNECLKQDEYLFTLKVNGEDIVGSLEKSPYDNTYCADIEQEIADDAEMVLQIVVDGNNFSQTLTNVSGSFGVDKDKAVAIACEELKDSVKSLSKEKGCFSEAFVVAHCL